MVCVRERELGKGCRLELARKDSRERERGGGAAREGARHRGREGGRKRQHKHRVAVAHGGVAPQAIHLYTP